jgi:hypothetical protein
MKDQTNLPVGQGWPDLLFPLPQEPHISAAKASAERRIFITLSMRLALSSPHVKNILLSRYQKS